MLSGQLFTVNKEGRCTAPQKPEPTTQEFDKKEAVNSLENSDGLGNHPGIAAYAAENECLKMARLLMFGTPLHASPGSSKLY